MVITEDEGIKLSKLASKMTRIMRRDSMLLDLMKKNLNFAIAFRKTYSEKLVASRIVDIVKDVIGSNFPIKLSVQTYCR